MDTRIYCVTHKQFTPPDMEGYYPLQVGSALCGDLGYLSDNTGDNISEKNKSYCELTGIYWIWKNISCDIVGICHYRRYFVKDEDFLTKEYIEDTLKKYDIIVSHSGGTDKSSLWEHYAANHSEADMNICREVVGDMYPEYLAAFDLCLNCNLFTLGNMMITRKIYLISIVNGCFRFWKRLNAEPIYQNMTIFRRDCTDIWQRDFCGCGL